MIIGLHGVMGGENSNIIIMIITITVASECVPAVGSIILPTEGIPSMSH